MKQRVSARMGDVFEGGADLTVLPCGAKGTWTGSVSRWIKYFGLPTPNDLNPSMSLGDLTPPAPFPGSLNVTKFVAYAASVLNDETSPEAIEKAGENIGLVTQSIGEIIDVESVLLGTGHGGLSDALAAEALTRGFLRTANGAARLSIVVQGHERHTRVKSVIEQALPEGAAMTSKLDDIKIAVIVALAEEYSVFLKYFDGTLVEKFHVGDLIIEVLESKSGKDRLGLVSVNRMGNVAAAIAATRLLEVFNLDVIVNLGLAAGVDSSKQRLGDIIIADKIRYYESGKVAPGGFELAAEFSDLRSPFTQALQVADLTNWALGTSIGGQPRRVLFGTVASGEKVISTAAFTQGLVSQDRKTVGIEMESYGIAAAVQGRSEKMLLIRGVSDFANEEKHDNARLSAMEGAVRFFNEALRRGLLRPHQSENKEIVSVETPKAYSVAVTDRIITDGIANNYIQISSRNILNEFQYRKSIIEKLAVKKNTMGEIRIFCIQLQIDFDEIRGDTKIEKAASIFDVLQRQHGLSLQDLEALIEAA